MDNPKVLQRINAGDTPVYEIVLLDPLLKVLGLRTVDGPDVIRIPSEVVQKLCKQLTKAVEDAKAIN